MRCSFPLLLLTACWGSAAVARPQFPSAPDWRDWPVTPGTWDYRQDARGSIALFGRPGADADLTLRCDLARHMIYLSRQAGALAAAPLTLTVRTSDQVRALAAEPTGGAYVAVSLAPSDALIDSIGYSRGHFVIEAPGLPALVLPAWAEILRVAEDCR